MEQYSKILLYAILGIAIVGGTIAVIREISKPTGNRGGGESQPESDPQASTNPEGTTVSDKEIISQIMKMLKYFNGDMGALLSIVNDPVIEEASVVFRNIYLTIDTHGDEMLKSWFSSYTNDREEWDTVLYKDKAAKLLSLLRQCGIQQSSELKRTWDENAAKHYRRLIKVEIGDECEVLSPYWIYENEIFEQGLVRPVSNNK